MHRTTDLSAQAGTTPLVSFCITSLRRNDQIMQTLPQNLQDNWSDRHDVEFVLVDFNPSIDDDHSLEQFVLQNFEDELRCDYLRYFQSDALPSWHASIAKNTAHSVARGRIVVNLDGDNYVGPGGARFVLQHFFDNDANSLCDMRTAQPLAVVLQQRAGTGTFGRIALRRHDFVALGGYNEQLAPMSAQDLDLMLRSAAYLRTHVTHANRAQYSFAIANDKKRSIRFCNDQSFGDMTWTQMKRHNEDLMRESRRQNGLLANVGCAYIGVAPDSLQVYCSTKRRLNPYDGEPMQPPDCAALQQHREERPEAFEGHIGRLRRRCPEQTARLTLLRKTIREANAPNREKTHKTRRERLARLQEHIRNES